MAHPLNPACQAEIDALQLQLDALRIVEQQQEEDKATACAAHLVTEIIKQVACDNLEETQDQISALESEIQEKHDTNCGEEES